MDRTEVEAVNRRVVERLFQEVLNGGDLAALGELYHPDVVDHDPYPGAPPGVAGVRHSISEVLGSYSTSRYTIEELLAQGDTVRVRVRFEGTPVRRLLGRPGTAVVQNIQTISFRLADGLITERRAHRQPRRRAATAPTGAVRAEPPASPLPKEQAT